MLALFAGCTKPETDIGLGLQPESELLDVVFTDTATVELATFVEDSLRTSRLSTGLVGQVFVPDFGQLDASVATQLRLSATDVNFGPNPVADSVFLQLHYTEDHYGRLTPMSFSVQPWPIPSPFLKICTPTPQSAPLAMNGSAGWRGRSI